MIRITNDCAWCRSKFRITLSEAIFPFTMRKYCHKNCNDSHVKAIEVCSKFSVFFMEKIKGENLGAVKAYPSNFYEMIHWPDWSPRGEKRRLSEGAADS